jgi:uncharacterized protein YuzE
MVEPKEMIVQVGPWSFDRAAYDARGDVLYLHRGDPSCAVEFDSSIEGHAMRYDDTGELVGLTIVNARWLLENEGAVTVTPPAPSERIEAADLAPVLTAAA